jgi:hypothetical protein
VEEEEEVSHLRMVGGPTGADVGAAAMLGGEQGVGGYDEVAAAATNPAALAGAAGAGDDGPHHADEIAGAHHITAASVEGVGESGAGSGDPNSLF